MANSLRNKIKHFCYKGYLSERERDRLLNALDDADRINSELKPCDDCISREDAIELIAGADETDGNEPVFNGKQVIKMLKGLPPVTPKARWIPIKTRPMTEEEKEEIGHEYAFMYDCPLPDDGQDVLITDCYGNVEVDTFCRDYEGFYFETNCDDGEVIAWMPLPKSYKGESENKE